jgi:hypothetical protein
MLALDRVEEAAELLRRRRVDLQLLAGLAEPRVRRRAGRDRPSPTAAFSAADMHACMRRRVLGPTGRGTATRRAGTIRVRPVARRRSLISAARDAYSLFRAVASAIAARRSATIAE